MPQTSYSQHGEDLLMAALVQAGTPQIVVDVGANDGQSWSNSRFFGLRGDRLLLIEAMPEYADRCRALYAGNSNVAVENVAVSAEEGVVEFHINMDAAVDELAMRSSLLRSMVPGDGVRTIKVACEPLQSILLRHAIPADFAILSVDAEGTDLTVLRSLDLAMYRPRAICVEGGALGEEIREHVITFGYRHVATLGVNCIYILTDEREATQTLAIQSTREGAIHDTADSHKAPVAEATSHARSVTSDTVTPQTDTLENSTAVENDLLIAAADAFHELGQSLDGYGYPGVGNHLYAAASELDQIVRPQVAWWSSAFNGQEGRRRLVLHMIDALNPVAVVETGTFRGVTTAFIAEHFSGPIYTCEVDQRWYLTAKAGLSRFSQIDIRRQDSRAFLRAVLNEAEPGLLLIYLDAHWQNDLPLAEELDLILSNGRPVAIMIDDFAVPMDVDYRFDDYGPGKALTLDLLAHLPSMGAALFFPTLPACKETGAQRGCAVIGVGGAIGVLETFAELGRHNWPMVDASPATIQTGAASAPTLQPLRRLAMAREEEKGTSRTLREMESLRSERDALGIRLEAAEKEQEFALAEVVKRQEEVRALHELTSGLREEQNKLYARMRDLIQSHDDLHREVIAVRASTSWRITRPLRALGRLLKR
jgi:FkbM family methyltransferase